MAVRGDDPRFALRREAGRGRSAAAAEARGAPAVLGYRLLQRQHDGIGRQRSLGDRRRRSRSPACRLGRGSGRARVALRRRLHRDGHGAQSAGPAPRSLHVELPRGAPLRTRRGTTERAASWLESHAKRAKLDRSSVPAARSCRSAANTAASNRNTSHASAAATAAAVDARAKARAYVLLWPPYAEGSQSKRRSGSRRSNWAVVGPSFSLGAPSSSSIALPTLPSPIPSAPASALPACARRRRGTSDPVPRAHRRPLPPPPSA